MPLPTMLCIYFMQNWYAMNDPAMEEALQDIESMRRFADLDLEIDAIAEETSLLNFRHLLEKNPLSSQMMVAVNRVLEGKG